ncbi:ABC transporter ATP-binding protein [candidate division KSB1 bacterium]|nr:MAG: ABC transporter ATP-binding protein [candidate division KSB1 bacterium]RKY78814.1 MAG: ABC transporter ATP-binding protein [candidate division KSB1 bacterium]RKY86227.1 MAG: ABC transporter ATP-binding protein [candidate division KSB1 bacterium]
MIVLKNIFKSFDNNHVLKGLNLEINDGETFTILGPSGSGKSVILKLIIGILKPDSGEIFVDGQNIVKFRRSQLMHLRTKFGFVFQSGALFDFMNVGENIALFLRMHKNLSEDKVRQIVQTSLALVDLHNVEHLEPEELSGGMLKRVSIARAIAIQPKYLLYDEPTTGLDPKTCNVITNMISRLQQKLGVTSVVVTHDIESAIKISNRIALLYDGKIAFVGNGNEILQTDDQIVKRFINGELH